MSARGNIELRQLIREEIERALASAQPVPSDVPEALDVDGAASFLNVSRDLIYDAASRGELPHRRLGKRLIFSRQALGQWLRGSDVT